MFIWHALNDKAVSVTVNSYELVLPLISDSIITVNTVITNFLQFLSKSRPIIFDFLNVY